MTEVKNVDAQIDDLEAQIEALKAKKQLLEHPIQEYPKHIQVPDPVQPYGVPTTTIIVNSAEEEKAALAKPADAANAGNRLTATAAERNLEAEKQAREDAEEKAKKGRR